MTPGARGAQRRTALTGGAEKAPAKERVAVARGTEGGRTGRWVGANLARARGRFPPSVVCRRQCTRPLVQFSEQRPRRVLGPSSSRRRDATIPARESRSKRQALGKFASRAGHP